MITRGGYDWTKRFPWIAAAALWNRRKHFMIDSEAVVLGVDEVSAFNALRSGKQNGEVQLCSFDILALDGEHLQALPLAMRKTNLERAARPSRRAYSSTRSKSIGPELLHVACNMGLEGLVSKRSDRPYRGGRSLRWNQGEEPNAPRVQPRAGGEALENEEACRTQSSGNEVPGMYGHWLCNDGTPNAARCPNLPSVQGMQRQGTRC
jgi:bifunctional non-homologous end joining protein LigD